MGPPSFILFGFYVALGVLRERRRIGSVLVQGYGVAALAANLAARAAGIPVVMLVCSPTEAYTGAAGWLAGAVRSGVSSGRGSGCLRG